MTQRKATEFKANAQDEAEAVVGSLEPDGRLKFLSAESLFGSAIGCTLMRCDPMLLVTTTCHSGTSITGLIRACIPTSFMT
jgi:hypothetical protein